MKMEVDELRHVGCSFILAGIPAIRALQFIHKLLKAWLDAR